MVVAGLRLDLLGMKVQYADEISHYYRDALQAHQETAQNPAARARVNRDIAQISATNGRLQDLRDGTTRAERFYSDLWLKESRPYWLANVQVRYAHLADIYIRKIQALKAAMAESRATGVMTAAEALGFYDPILPRTPASPSNVPPLPQRSPMNNNSRSVQPCQQSQVCRGNEGSLLVERHPTGRGSPPAATTPSTGRLP